MITASGFLGCQALSFAPRGFLSGALFGCLSFGGEPCRLFRGTSLTLAASSFFRGQSLRFTLHGFLGGARFACLSFSRLPLAFTVDSLFSRARSSRFLRRRLRPAFFGSDAWRRAGLVGWWPGFARLDVPPVATLIQPFARRAPGDEEAYDQKHRKHGGGDQQHVFIHRH